jgi:hypothetical protein
MPYMHPDAIEYRREQWMRPDTYRFAKPGSPEAEAGFLHPWAEVARREQAAADEAKAREAAERAEFEREVEALRASQARLRRTLAEVKYELAWRRIVRKYSPDQPRVPAGNPDGGQWTDGGGGGADGEESSVTAILAGGITDDQLSLTVQTFVSTYCLGSINRQLPGQFMGVTIADVMAEAQRGNAAARTCLKLLMQDRFRK